MCRFLKKSYRWLKTKLTKRYRRLITPFYELYYSRLRLKGICLNTEPRAEHVVASLTSYPARFGTLHLCIKSILNQSVKADKVILWLDDFVRDEEIPASVTALKANGLEIKKIPYDLKPHKKYFFAMQEFPDFCVITFDDDSMYRKNSIKKLLLSYRAFPNAVSALRVRKIIEKKGRTATYAEWRHARRGDVLPSFSLVATGVGGILYPPHILPESTFDVDAIKRYCHRADDIWLKFMELKNNVPVVWKKTWHEHPVTISIHRDSGLNIENVAQNRNDAYIKAMESYTGISLAEVAAL